MTPEEMQKRVEELGGWSEINAIRVSLEKYQELLAKDKPPLLDEIESDTCGCCQWYLYQKHGKCNACVFEERRPCCKEWQDLMFIIECGKPGDWRKPVRAMIKIMEEALEEKSENVKNVQK